MSQSFSDAVKQKNFRSEQTKAALNIIFTANQLEEITRNMLKSYDISSEQYNVLRILRGKHPDSFALQDIRERMLNRWSNVSRLVEKLRKKEYLDRRPLESNRRKVEIIITQKGLDFLKELEDLPLAKNLYDKALTDAEAKQLTNLLDTFRSNLQQSSKQFL